MSERIDELPENELVTTIRNLERELQEIKSKQSVGGEIGLSMNEWFGSFKTSSSYVSLNGSLIVIDFDDWKNYSWYWENIIFTDGGTGWTRLYNITDDVAVPDTEFSTTAVGEANAEYNRTGVLTKYTGIKEFKTQVKITGGGGGQNVNSIKSRMIFKIEN
jgi:hypothetical protein